MKFYDISTTLSAETPAWPGSQPFLREEFQTSAITSKLTLASHYATHVDAPKHFLFDKKSIDLVSLPALVGTFKVLAVSSKRQIMVSDILAALKDSKQKIAPGDRILFKTRNSKFVGTKTEFTEDYVSLSAEGAAFLAKAKIALVGIDYFGIEAKGQPGHPTHTALLQKNIVIVEGLDLKKVSSGRYNGAILPLKIKDGDGAPARAVLWK